MYAIRSYYVIACDQILSLDGKRFDKPKNIKEARENLIELRGKQHSLINGMVILRNGQIIWQYDNEVKLHMRDFSDEFLDYYIEQNKDQICTSVGAYQLENIVITSYSIHYTKLYEIKPLSLAVISRVKCPKIGGEARP